MDIVREVKKFLSPLNDWNKAVIDQEADFYDGANGRGPYYGIGFYNQVGGLGIYSISNVDDIDYCPEPEDMKWLDIDNIPTGSLKKYVDQLPGFLEQIIAELEWDDEYQEKYDKKHDNDISVFIFSIQLVIDSIRNR